MPGARDWGRSLELMLKDEDGFKRFKNFLKEDESDENIDFWKRVENYREITNKLRQEKEANAIFKNFVMNNSRRCVILKGPTRSKIALDLKVGANSHIFDEAQKEIIAVMQRDSYQRFLKSDTYKKLLM